MRVILIDDNDDDRALVARVLLAEYPDAEVVEAADRGPFLAALAAAPPRLVVTDYDLRWGTGLEVLRAVKAAHPGCPVVMFTGTGSEEIAVEAMKSGLDDYVVKGARRMARLRTTLRLALENAGRRAALAEAEAALRQAQEGRIALLRELHHRLKNGLQTVVGMLRLRAARYPDPGMRSELLDMAGRVRALATIQERIYAAEESGRVDFRGYLETMAQEVAALHGGRAALRLDIDGPLDIDLQRASPLGLLCHELLVNAFRHAFPAGRRGTIAIAARIVGTEAEIVIADDGIGFERTDTEAGLLGLRVVEGLAAEAAAVLDIESSVDRGTTARIRLPL
ncbi:MAG TPA: histidine kinase dimerization/phosphoacceptor domain -containing protein [Alphaproteobacteria bacterium]|nr:histidine kinase dimerization/phosphoacceptor domain -containing protein [Alphaproteobacteria bacterium]